MGTNDFVVYCDTSCEGLDCVLMQYGQFLVYASRKLMVHERNCLNHDLELAVVVFTLKIWRHHLFGVKCELFINHRHL